MGDFAPELGPAIAEEQGSGAEVAGDVGEVGGLIARMRAGDRDAAAELVREYGDLIRRRIRGKLNSSMRRLFDSQDILSSVSRRLDRYVRSGRVDAVDQAQLWSLVFKIAEVTVVDRARAFERLNAVEGEDSPVAHELLRRMERAERAEPNGSEIVLEKAYLSLASPDDREMLTLWLADTPMFRIAETLRITPAAARQRWRAVRSHLKHNLESGTL
jgi:DNA-directed RNA polymerase specialized sigma24 family protein